MTTGQFVNVVEREGLEYTLTGYWSRRNLEELENPEICEIVLRAHDALKELHVALKDYWVEDF